MDCDRLREVLIDHVDGLLGRDDAEAARTHLAACDDCRRLQEEVRRNFAALDAWEDEELPAGAFERLARRLPAVPAARAPVARELAPVARELAPAAVSAPPRRGWVRLAVPYAAGLATAAAVVGFFVLPRGGAPAPANPGSAPVARELAPAAVPAPVAKAAPVPAPGRLRPGERTLMFADADHGVIRTVSLPEGIDPGSLQFVTVEEPAVGSWSEVR